jgi:acetamidase/formamidase
MDISEITTGATIYLPVRVDGALLHLGDAHAIQGDGEVSGAAVEMPAKVRLQIDLLRADQPIAWPRLENRDMLFAIASMQTGRDMQDTIRLAFMELLLWLEKDYSLDRWLMFELLTFEARIRIGNFWTVAVGIEKK